MFRLRSPVSACVLLSASLAAAVAANAQTKPKTAPKSTAAPKEKEPAKKSADAEKAEEGYKTVCQACHLADGKGLTPDMSFTDGVWKHGTTTEAMAKVIAEGVPGTVMLPYKDRFTKEEILELVKIVRSFDPKLKGKK
jgi:mono/diheme cytochrome c family protein